MRGSYQRKERTVICQRCGAEFTAKSEKAKWCPPCNTRVHIERSNRIRAARKAAAAVTSVDLAGRTHDMSAADVPDVPTDDYYSIEDKIKKTAPIETVLVPKKEDKEMDTERAERLKSFPSMSNRLEHPEYFTGDDMVKPTVTAPSYSPADNGTTVDMPDIPAEQVEKMKDALREGFRKDRKSVILSLYSTICDICRDVEITVPEVLDRLTRIDEALS